MFVTVAGASDDVKRQSPPVEPALIVLDGPDYAVRGRLAAFLRACPPVLAVLQESRKRDEDYSASARFAKRLAAQLPPGRRIGVGASLGALALLHAHRTAGVFDALFLQSGSYFRRETDPQERDFPRFARIERFVRSVRRGDGARPIPITMTCGTREENLANNRAMRDALAEQGYEVSLIENRGGHTWSSWRSFFEPHLRELIERFA